MSDQTGKISVCALVPYLPNTTPSQRFRLEQWMPYLLAEGISVDLVPFADERLMRLLHAPGRWVAKAAVGAGAFFRRGLDIALTPRYDVVVIHRAACIAGPALLERAMKLFRRPVIFDFDDAIFLKDTTEANRHFGWLKFPGKTATICRISSHVVVGNSHLAAYARKYNQCVTVIPSSVDTERYRPKREKNTGERVVVGWTGSSTSQTHLEMFAPVLRRLTAQHNIELRVISNREPVLPGIDHVWHPWSAETEVKDLAKFDIGIMPMPDNPWSRGKCSMKALLYMAMGIPTICSAVGANRELVQHGENGFLATTPEEWLAALEALIDDPDLRQRLGAAGRRTVEERYSMQRCAELFAKVIRETIEK